MSASLTVEPGLQRPLLDLVVATLWADGDVGDREIAAARGAQIALGLVHPSDDAELAIGHGTSGSWRALAQASLRDRVLAYSAAVWTALADRVIDPGEARFLRRLRGALALDDAAVRFADGLARYVDARARDEGHAAHRSFSELLIQGGRRVAQVAARRADAQAA